MLLTSSPNPLQQPHQHIGSSSKFHCGLHDGKEVSTLSTNQQPLPDIIDPAFTGPPRPPNSPIHIGLDLPGWERLIRSIPASGERISLIMDILSNGNEVKMVECLCGDEAQSFIDAVYEARYHPLFSPESMSADFRSLLIRRWVASIMTTHHGRGVCTFCAIFVVAIPYFQNHWTSKFPATERETHCTGAGLRMCGKVYLTARRLRSGC